MAQGDQNLIFSSAQAITASANSTNVLDLATGLMVAENGTYLTNAAAGLALTFGNAQFFGEDLGIGVRRLKLGAWTGAAAFLTGTSLTIGWQLAPDNGGGTIAGLTFTTYASGNAIAAAQLTASQLLPMPDYPYDIAGASNPPPRFVRLAYTVAGSSFTAGSITAGLFNALSFNRIGSYPSGFSVGA